MAKKNADRTARRAKRRHFFQSAAVSALLSALLCTAARAEAGEGPARIEATHWESSRTADPHIMSQTARKKAALAAIGAVVSGLIGVMGPHRVLQVMVDAGRFLFRAAAYILSNPLKAAGRAASVVGRVAKDTFKGPGRFLLLFGGLILFAMTGVAAFDQQWTIGILVGLSIGYLAAAGLTRAKNAARTLWAKVKSAGSKEPPLAQAAGQT